MAAMQTLARISEAADPTGHGKRVVYGVKDSDVWIARDESGERYCEHTHKLDALVSYLKSNRGQNNICPDCAGRVGAPDDGDWFVPVLTIWGILAFEPTLSSMRDLASRAGLINVFDAGGPFTLFAPNNDAIGRLSAVPSGEDLVSILKHHVVMGRIVSTDVGMGTTELETLAGTKITIRREGFSLFVGDARVASADIRATNGVVHTLDRVLVPSTMSAKLSARASERVHPVSLETGVGHPMDVWQGSLFEAIAGTPRLSMLTESLRWTGLAGTLDAFAGASLTIFTPTNEAFRALGSLPEKDQLRSILLHHVIKGHVLSSRVPAAGSVYFETLAGDTVRMSRNASGGVVVDGIDIILADFEALNGVAHVVGSVLLPAEAGAAASSIGALPTASLSDDNAKIGNHGGAAARVMFDAFNVSPDPFTTHRSESAAADVKLAKFEGRFKWTSSVGEGFVLEFERQRTAYGMGINELMPDATKTSDFEIAYTVMLPEAWDNPRASDANDDKTVILMLHGVPTNRRWKYHMMEIMAKRGCIVVACDLLGMGESTQVMDYRRFDQSESESDVNSAWDWEHDVAWLTDFIKAGILDMRRLGFGSKKQVIVAADDWGAGPAEWLFAKSPEVVQHLMLINPIHLDGYFVIEIGTIGRIDAVRRLKGNAAFQQGAFTLPQVILGIEKYMIQDRKRMNRYTETSFLSPYQDTHYQAGRTAAGMHPNYWNLAVLAARASRLAPYQLQPRQDFINPAGLPFETMPHNKPTDIIWGIEDQMMPPIQMWRSVYAFPGRLQTHAIADANHFSEIDQPYRVADAMTSAILREDKMALPIFLGDNPEFVYKGDEAEMRLRLAALFPKAPTTSIVSVTRIPAFPEGDIVISTPDGVRAPVSMVELAGAYTGGRRKIIYTTRSTMSMLEDYVKSLPGFANATVSINNATGSTLLTDVLVSPLRVFLTVTFTTSLAPELARVSAPESGSKTAVFPKRILDVAGGRATLKTWITLTGSYNQDIELYYAAWSTVASIKITVRKVTERPNATVTFDPGYVVDDTERLVNIVLPGRRLVLYVDLDA